MKVLDGRIPYLMSSVEDLKRSFPEDHPDYLVQDFRVLCPIVAWCFIQSYMYFICISSQSAKCSLLPAWNPTSIRHLWRRWKPKRPTHKVAVSFDL